MSYEMKENVKKWVVELIDDTEKCLHYSEHLDNAAMLRVIMFQTNERPYKMMQVCYNIFRRYGYSKEEFIERIEKERCRQEKLHPYDENIDYAMIALEEYGEMIKAYNDNDENGLIEELIQFVSVIVRIQEI